jgi:hypothetical protein
MNELIKRRARMTKRVIIFSLLLFIVSGIIFSTDLPQTKAEATGFKETSNYADILSFLNSLQEQSHNIQIQNILDTDEGHKLLMAIIADPLPSFIAGAKYDSRPVVYIQANIHAGEVAGSNAVQMLMREMLLGKLKHLPKEIIFLIVPNFNTDGNEHISVKNRIHIPTPEGGVGTRQNSQNLDLNRDYVKVDSLEVKTTIEKIYNEWDPLITFDLHTTNGSFHTYKMTYLTALAPIISNRIIDYSWKKMLPEIAKTTLEKDGLTTLPYGDYVDDLKPELGWASFPDSPRLCASYVPFRGRFSILLEAYSYEDFKTRVKASYDFLLRSLEFVAKNSMEMKKIVNQVDQETSSMANMPYEKRPKMPLAYKMEANGTITIHGFEVEKSKEENVYPRFVPIREKTFIVPLLNNFIAIDSRTYAAGYILPAGASEIADHLHMHGIRIERIEKAMTIKFKRFIFSELKASSSLNQGHWQTNVKGEWKEEEGIITGGSYYISMAQPFARLIAVMLEPDNSDSLLAWNFFDSWLSSQWGNQLLPYPVLRVDDLQQLKKISLLK